MMATPQCTTPTNLTPPEGGWTPTALVAAFGARELRPGEAPTLRQVLEAWSDADVRRAGALAEHGSHLYWIATRLLEDRGRDRTDPAVAAEVERVLGDAATPVLQAMSRSVIRGTDFDRAIERELSRRFETWMGRGGRQRVERAEEV